MFDSKLIKKMIEEMETKINATKEMMERTEVLLQFMHGRALTIPSVTDSFEKVKAHKDELVKAIEQDTEFLNFLKGQL